MSYQHWFDLQVFERLLFLLGRRYTARGEKKMADLAELPLDLLGLRATITLRHSAFFGVE